jgi:hypothetical protein
VACPFFMPVEKLENGAWLHPGRLPLGCGWSGQCTAPGHAGEVPSQEELREFCNLGYAEGCGRLPRERAWDSVRFAARTVSGDGGDAFRFSMFASVGIVPRNMGCWSLIPWNRGG